MNSKPSSTRKTKSSITSNTQAKNMTTEPKNFWQILMLKFIDSDSPVWYDLENQEIDIVPTGYLIGVDAQIREFEGKLDYRLLISLVDNKNFLILTMGLKTISALSVIEPLCLLPDSCIKSEITFGHEFVKSSTNTFIKFRLECEGKILNAPLSSGTAWRNLSFCFRRVAQLQRKLAGYASLDFQAIEFDSEF